MNPKRRARLLNVLIMLALIALAVFYALKSFNENLMYFFSPSDVSSGKAPLNSSFRLGGLVKKASVHRDTSTTNIEFTLTDFQHEISVEFHGILPDLFREGQGIVATGKLQNINHFVASEVLAKHDENYMPPEVANSLNRENNQ